jgi:hypothetical protein
MQLYNQNSGKIFLFGGQSGKINNMITRAIKTCNRMKSEKNPENQKI